MVYAAVLLFSYRLQFAPAHSPSQRCVFIYNKRYNNACDLSGYLKNPLARYEIQHLNGEERLLECIMLELRLINGIDRGRFKARFGVDICELYSEKIKLFVDNKLLELSPEALKLTDKGLDLADWVVLQLID